MQLLSANLLRALKPAAPINSPKQIAGLPERVLQFGTGVLLRALPDYFIDKANRKGIFNGKILLVKTTGHDVSDFTRQDNLYTIAVRGVESGAEVSENIIIDSISRVLHASESWPLVLKAAYNKELGIIISNTTEKGIIYQEESIFAMPPVSYPAKLLAFLYERFNAFGGTIDSGLVILPTELIIDNATKLKAILLQLADYNKLGDLFYGWLSYHNYFCNTLVDRIVPGKPAAAFITDLETSLGYRDELLCMAEPYCLWAIEGGKDIAAKLSFNLADDRMIISTNIESFRELKLRLLNGTHSLAGTIAVLAGFDTVSQAMSDDLLGNYIGNLLMNELLPAIPYQIETAISNKFGLQVLDRFKNKALNHYWLTICTDVTSKLRIRVLPVLVESFKLRKPVPRAIALSFAAYIVFMKSSLTNGIYKGQAGTIAYEIKDESAAIMHTLWLETSEEKLAAAVLGNAGIWATNLNGMPGFSQSVQAWLNMIRLHGIMASLNMLAADLQPGN